MSSSKQISPWIVVKIALQWETAIARLKVESLSAPRRQLRPPNNLGLGVPEDEVDLMFGSACSLEGDLDIFCSILHTLTCRVPTLIAFDPIQEIELTLLHLLLECRLAEPVFGSIE